MVRGLAPSLSLNSGLDPGGLSHDAEVVRAYRADPLVHARVSAALGIDLIDLGDELLPRAPDLRSPTLVVHGGSDPITSALASREFAVRSGPACTYHEVPGALHEVHHESTWPDTWRVMSEWLEARLTPADVAANRR